MPVENMSREFGWKKLRNYLITGISQNELMSKKHKKVCRVLNYIEQLLIVTSKILDAFLFLFLLL